MNNDINTLLNGKNFGLILAAGSSTRFQNSHSLSNTYTPKQLICIHNKPIVLLYL